MNDPGHVRALTHDLLGGQDITHRAQSVRRPIRNEVRATAGPPQLLHDQAQADVAVFIPGNVMDDGAVKPVEEDVAGLLIARLGIDEAAPHDPKMAFEPQPDARRRHLACRVGLHDAAANDAIGVLRPGRGEVELQFAYLVAPGAETGAVVAFHPQRAQIEPEREFGHLLHRRRQMSQTSPG